MLSLKCIDLILNTALFTSAYVVSITLAEAGQALLAAKCGDDTAVQEGWTSLNPLDHIKLIDFIILIFAGFMWIRSAPLKNDYQEDSMSEPRVLGISFAPSLIALLVATLTLVVLVFFFGIAPLSSSFIAYFLNRQAFTTMVALYPAMSSLSIVGTLFLISLVLASLIIASLNFISTGFRYIIAKTNWFPVGAWASAVENQIALLVVLLIACSYLTSPLRYLFLLAILKSITFIGYLLGVV